LAKGKKFICKVCGHTTFKWTGRCPECGEWDSMVEKETVEEEIPSVKSTPPRPASEISLLKEKRYLSKIGEFDRILGGGIVPGSLVLIGGEPGIGKSTLLMEVAQKLSSKDLSVLYISGEESLYQVQLRALRLGIDSSFLYIMAENNLKAIQNEIEKLKPKVVVIDSIQTVYLDNLDSPPGSISQIRECTSSLIKIGKKKEIAIFLVGHVTKDGSIAGPRIMEHMVDTVLYFETSKDYQYRILRATKNRFGPTSEIGIFKMTSGGLVEVIDSSNLFITDSLLKTEVPGTAVVPTVEGSRIFLIEIQALVTRSNLTLPRRVTQGVDYNRICVLLAVLERRGFNFYQKDVYVNVAGGVKIEEPACDMAIALSLASSAKNRPVRQKTVAVGEVGLTGEIRPAGFMEKRLKEVKKLGFERCIGSLIEEKEARKVKGIEFIGVKSIEEAIQEGLKER